MRKIIFILLALLCNIAVAGQEFGYKKADNKTYVYYTTYQAASMSNRDLEGTAVAMRHCKKVNAGTFLRKEGLAYDHNVVGAFYCQHPGELRAYVIVKKFKLGE